MKSKKIEVFEFDPQIYPIKFWILINPTKESILNNFVSLDDLQLKVEDKDLNKDLVDAFIYDEAVYYNKTKLYGFILCINNLESITPSVMAHESTHLAGYAWKYLREPDIDYKSEANAYFVEWFVDCIDQVITKLKK